MESLLNISVQCSSEFITILNAKNYLWQPQPVKDVSMGKTHVKRSNFTSTFSARKELMNFDTFKFLKGLNDNFEGP